MSENLILIALIIFLLILLTNEYGCDAPKATTIVTRSTSTPTVGEMNVSSATPTIKKEYLAPMLKAALEGDEQSYKSNVHRGYYKPLMI